MYVQRHAKIESGLRGLEIEEYIPSKKEQELLETDEESNEQDNDSEGLDSEEEDEDQNDDSEDEEKGTFALLLGMKRCLFCTRYVVINLKS